MKRGRLLAICLATLACVASAKDKARQPTLAELKAPPIEIKRDAQVDASAARAMENYRKFLELRRTDPALRAEALRRLGDLNLEAGELERMENEVSALDIQGAEAIRLYSALLTAYPDYPRNDQVLYQLARAYETTGQTDKALATLDRIVAQYAATPQIDEVQFRRGEILFSARRYPEAQIAYEKVIALGRKSAFYDQSLYKHGWALFKQSLSEESLPSFAGVLDENLIDRRNKTAVVPLAKLSRADRELVDDTLRVMAITFSFDEAAGGLEKFIGQRGVPAYSHLMYQRLGDLYVDKQRYQDAATTYKAYVTRNPVSEYSPSLAMAGIEAYRKAGFALRVLESQRDFIDLYRFESPFWQGRKRESFPEIEKLLKVSMKDVATWYHVTAQASKKPEDFQATALRYRDLLAAFPAENDTPVNRYLLADALFEGQQFGEATVEYEKTAYDYARYERSGEAAYAGMVSRNKALPALQGEPRNQWHRASIDAGVKFATTFPEHPQSALVITRAAQDVFELPDLPRAIVVAQQVLAHPGIDAPKRRIAWTIVGQSQFELGKFAEAELALGRARDLLPPNDKLRADLTERMATSIYRQAEARRSAGDMSGAVDDFLRVASVAPNSPVRATAEYDAAAALVNMKQWPRAIEVLTAYRRNYPDSQYQRNVTRNLAVAYNEANRPADAALEFERISGDAGEEPAVRRESLMSAADAFEKAGNSTRLGAALERFVTQYPQPVPEAIEVRQRLATLAATRNDKPKLEFWRREIVKADANAGAARTDRTRTLAARAQLALAEPARDAFNGIKLVLPLKKSLDAKRKALDAALKGYRLASDYQISTVTSSANFAMAELYRQLARDLLASQRPKGLGKDALEEYNLLLEEQAFPFEEQSIELHEINTVRAREGWYDEGVRSSYGALAELKPGRYGKSEVGIKPGLEPADDPVATEENLRKVLEANSQDVAALNALGIALRQQGKFEDARKAYEQALTVDPADASAHRNLAVLLDLYLNDPGAALASFERYKEITGEDKPVSTWIAEVRARAPKPPAPEPTPEPAPEPAPADATAAPPAPTPNTPDPAPPQTGQQERS